MATLRDGTTRRASLQAYSTLGKADLNAWLSFFADHQEGKIAWKDGMLFKLTSKAATIQLFDDGTVLSLPIVNPS